MDKDGIKATPDSHFRNFLPDLSEGKWQSLPGHTASTWYDESCKSEFLKGLMDNWVTLAEQPFKGVTYDGHIIPNLYRDEDHGLEVDRIVTAVNRVIALCSSTQLSSLCQPINSKIWRRWSNPEIYFSPFGLRLEELSQEHSDAILQVVECSLSPKGFEKIRNAMRTNEFLGQLCNGAGVLNQRSYNFVVFGEPSADSSWGWNLYGHHLCLNVFVHRGMINIAPVFIGAEPNEIDEGPHRGTKMLQVEESLGLQLMQSLDEDQKQVALVYANMCDEAMPPERWNRADQRHLAGAYQDNRIIPYEGLQVVDMKAEQQDIVSALLKEFLIYLPDGALASRMQQIKKFWAETYFCWIGGHGATDPFYFRIQSPVVVVEFDHHSGVFLANKEPQRFHIHTIARAPNGGDYGNALRELADRLR
ncbi:hypothetical protein E8E14_014639 [Neopestalotiopsis sp. 37M]|nr:hypothetical protein E8E14_014639 [Neopestalotiopsis sp. 37M]